MPTTPDKRQDFNTLPTPDSQPRMKLPITPANSDFVFSGATIFAKAISVHTQQGGRVRLVYLPDKNADEDVVDIYVYDGWVSDTTVRRVVSAVAQTSGDTVTIWGLFN